MDHNVACERTCDSFAPSWRRGHRPWRHTARPKPELCALEQVIKALSVLICYVGLITAALASASLEDEMSVQCLGYFLPPSSQYMLLALLEYSKEFYFFV